VATVLWKRLGEGDCVTDSGEQEQFLVGVMEKALVGYEEGRSDLGRLVRRVDSAIDELANVSDADWVAELRRSWGELEIIYALMLNQGRSNLNDEERRDVAGDVVALRALIAR
jgi:hypothetical protein